MDQVWPCFQSPIVPQSQTCVRNMAPLLVSSLSMMLQSGILNKLVDPAKNLLTLGTIKPFRLACNNLCSRKYLETTKMFRNYADASTDPVYSAVYELDLVNVVPSMSGPKRPHDRVPVSNMKADFGQCLQNPVGFKGFNIPSDKHNTGRITDIRDSACKTLFQPFQ